MSCHPLIMTESPLAETFLLITNPTEKEIAAMMTNPSPVKLNPAPKLPPLSVIRTTPMKPSMQPATFWA
jgi:hypothetical protein